MSRTIYLKSKMVGATDDNLIYIVAHGSIEQSKLAMKELRNRESNLLLLPNSQVIYYRILDLLRGRTNPLTAMKILEHLNSDTKFKIVTKSDIDLTLENMKANNLVRKTGAAWIDVRGGAKRY